MKLPFDPSHLEMPVNVVVAVAGSIASLAVAAWQFIGSWLAQLPTPDQVTGWQERDIYLCTAIIFALAILMMARWIAGSFLASQTANTAALNAVAAALERWDTSMDNLVQPAVQRAMDGAFPHEPHRPLGSGRKRGPAQE